MKKFLSIISISICLLLFLVGCNNNKIENNKTTETSDEIIKVMENVYVDYINDIYLDREKYLGKVIEIEGMFTRETDDKNKNHMYVYRIAKVIEYNPEDVKMVEKKYGLEFLYNKDIPKEDDWIKVTGKLVQKHGSLIIEAKSVEVLKDRGLEKVKSFY